MSDPYRWRVADNQTQRTLGGNIMELHETGNYVLWHDYASLREVSIKLESMINPLKAEVERLKMEHKIKAIPVELRLIDRIAELKAEVERLTRLQVETLNERNKAEAEVERLEKTEEYLQNTLNQYALDDMRLQAQVERLTKAGDAMLKYACANVTYPRYATMVKDWNAAKESKQP